MRLEQIDPINTPEEFFFSRLVPEEIVPEEIALDDDGVEYIIPEHIIPEHVAYDLTHEEETVATGKKINKRVKNGVQSVHVHDDISVDVYLDDALVATWFVQGQYDQSGWQNFNRAWQYVDVVDGHIQGSGTQGAFSWDIDIPCFYGEDNKWTVNVVAPGFTVRMIWEITLTELGQQLFANGDLKINTDGYTGNVSDDEGAVVRTIIFEPDGLVDGLEIDPYISVDEQATYIDVHCDGFVARTYSNGSEAFLGRIYDPTITDIWFTFGSKVVVGGTTYCISEDTGITLEIVENTSTRVRLRAVGDFEDSGQSSLADESGSSLELYIYPDRIAMTAKFNATASITLSDNAANGLCFMDTDTITSGDSKYESTGSEADAGGDGVQSSADYIATLSDECNVQGIMTESTLGGGDSTYIQYIDDPGVALRFGWNNGTVTALTTLTVMWIIDSTDREKNSIFSDTFSTGSDLNSNWTDFGSHDFSVSGGVAKPLSTWDTCKAYHNVSGTVETDYLIGHWKCDDNAASSTVVDEVASSDGNWEVTSTSASRDTDNDSITDPIGGRSLDSKGLYSIDMVVGSGTIHDNDFLKKGSITLQIKPQFAYDVGADESIWRLRYDDNNLIDCWYESNSDDIRFRVIWGGAAQVVCDTDAFTSNNELQQWTTIHCCWDSDKDFMALVVNGETIETGSPTGTPTASHPGEFEIARRGSGDGDIIIDEIKTFDACIPSIGSADNWAQADLEVDLSQDDSSGVLFRYDYSADTGYAALFNASGRLYLRSWNGSSYTWVATGTVVSRIAGMYTVFALITGTTIKVYVDGTIDIDATSSTYSSGNYAGMVALADGSNYTSVDNFSCGTAFKYTSVERLEIGDEFKDFSLGEKSKWVGFPNDEGTPDSPIGSWAVYGTNSDRVYCREWTATEDGTITHLNAMGTTEDYWQEAWLVVYNGSTLIGTVDLASWSPTNDWNGEKSVTVYGGESLDFSTNDVIRFGIAWDNDLSGSTALNRDNGAGADGGIPYDNTSAVEGNPPTTASFNVSTTYGFGIILRYTAGDAPDTGTWVSDLIIPKGIDDGATDGALHIDAPHFFQPCNGDSSVLFYLDFEGDTEAERCTDKIGSIAANEINGATTTTHIAGSRGYDSGGVGDVNYSNATNIIDPLKGSIMFWFNFQTFGNNDYLFGAGPNTNNKIQLYITLSTNYYLGGHRIAGGTGTSCFDTVYPLTLSTWYHARLSWDEDWSALWLNGILIEEHTDAGIWAGTISTVYIGKEYDDTSDADAIFDQIYITNNPNTPRNCHDAKFTNDRARHNLAVVKHDPMFLSGTVGSETFLVGRGGIRTDHLIGHWKCDDNAASSTVLAEVGPNANYEVISSQASRDTDNDSTTDAVSGRALDTKDAYFIDMVCGSGTVHDNDFYQNGSVMITFKPNFVYNVGYYRYIFELNVGVGDERIYFLYDNYNDYFRLTVDYGTAVEIMSPVYTENNTLQQYHTALLSWSTDNDFMLFALDGKVIGTNTGLDTPSSSHPAAFTFGCNDTYNTLYAGDIIIDEIKTFDACILPEVDYLAGHWKCDDNEAASSAILAAVGPNANWEDVATSSDRNTDNDSITDATRGRALDTKGLYYVDMVVGSGTIHDNDFLKKGSVLFTFNPQFIYNVGANQHIYYLRYNDSDAIEFWYNHNSDYFNFRINYGGSAYDIVTSAYTESNSLQQWHTVLLSWDSDNDFGLFVFDGQVIGTATPTATPTTSHPIQHRISRSGGSSGSDIIIDEIKTFSSCILPYGSIFTGNGAVDTDVAEKSVLFYLDFEGADDATRRTDKINSVVGTYGSSGGIIQVGAVLAGTYGYNNQDISANYYLEYAVTNQDIVNLNIGAISLWVYLDYIATNDRIFEIGTSGDADNSIGIQMNTSVGLIATYRANGVNESVQVGSNQTADLWYHLLMTYDSLGTYDNKIHFYVNGEEVGTAQTIANEWNGTLSPTLYFGCDRSEGNNAGIYIDQVYITNDPNTPQNWTAFGVPLHVPLLEIT